MTGPTLELILGAASLASVAVFIAAFRFARREAVVPLDQACHAELPRAWLRSPPPHRRLELAVRGHLGDLSRTLQAGFVALGITAIFIMSMCMAGVIAVMIVGR